MRVRPTGTTVVALAVAGGLLAGCVERDPSPDQPPPEATATVSFSGGLDGTEVYDVDCDEVEGVLRIELTDAGFEDGLPELTVLVRGAPADPVGSATHEATYRLAAGGEVREVDGQITVSGSESGDRVLYNLDASFEVDGSATELTGTGNCGP